MNNQQGRNDPYVEEVEGYDLTPGHTRFDRFCIGKNERCGMQLTISAFLTVAAFIRRGIVLLALRLQVISRKMDPFLGAGFGELSVQVDDRTKKQQWRECECWGTCECHIPKLSGLGNEWIFQCAPELLETTNKSTPLGMAVGNERVKQRNRMKGNQLLYLSRQEVTDVGLTINDIIEAVENGFRKS